MVEAAWLQGAQHRFHADRKGKGLVMFRIGDLVVHPMHGAGVIDNIVQERVAGTTQEYYVFHMPVNGLVLKIPISSSDMVGLRPVVDADTACMAITAPAPIANIFPSI